MSNYADYTYQSKNVLKRFSHQRRLKHALNLIQTDGDIRLLDFGCGDGKFLHQLRKTGEKNIALYGFEPMLGTEGGDGIPIFKTWNEVQETANIAQFNCITCFEVLEHFSPPQQIRLIEQITGVLEKDGILIISVPVEIGIPSLIKNLIRKRSCNGKSKYLYTCRNIFRAFLGKPFSDYRQGNGYLYDHMGFYYRDLEKILCRYFQLIEKTYSPFNFLGSNFNSQIFYKVKVKK